MPSMAGTCRPQLAYEMAEFFALGFEVALEGRLGGDRRVDALGHLDACGFEGCHFFRVVGDEADGGDAEVLEDGSGKFKGAEVSGIAELVVGLDGVQALILQLVRAELGHEADATAFLLLVEEDARALVGDALEREVELIVAVATERVEDVAGEALGVDANDRRCRGPVGRGRVDVAHDEGDGGFQGLAGGVAWLRNAFEAEDAEGPPAGGEVGVGDLGEAKQRHGMSLDSGARGRMRRPE